MQVVVKLIAGLRCCREGKEEIKVEIKEEAQVSDLIYHLGINPKDIAMVVVNGNKVRFEDRLNDNDKVRIYPPVGGGLTSAQTGLSR